MNKFIIALLSFFFVIGNIFCTAYNDEIGLTVNNPIVNGNRIDFSMTANTGTDNVYVITALYDENNVLSAVKVNDLNGHFDVGTSKKYMMKIFVWDKNTLRPKCESYTFDSLQTSSQDTLPQTGYTQSVPSEYTSAADKQGTVEMLTYSSKDYAGNGADIEKTAYVYLPYGYDEADTETRYDIVYLMHGWGGHAGEYFDYRGTKNVFDNLIANGDMPPAIIVSATFYNENSGTDFGSSENELRAFHNDFENHLMQAVEGKYHTYAKSTAQEDLKASRDHRAFGVFSLGSVTTWLEFCYDYDYIRYFLPMSGSCWYYGTYGNFRIKDNVDYIEQLIKDNNLDERGYFIYHAVGTNDTVKSQSVDMANEMLSRTAFTPDKYVFYQKDGGYHDLDAVQEYLYNALPHFFRQEEKADFEPFTTLSKIDDVINDDAFDGYGRLIFPANKSYFSGTTLGNLRLTWYIGVDTADYSLWGGSAGARMAATLGSYTTDTYGEKKYPQPAAVIMQYTGHSEVTGTEPPIYNCVGTSDGIASYTTMQQRINRIKANGTDTMIEIFDGLPHGFGLGEETIAYGWLDNAVDFWERNMSE